MRHSGREILAVIGGALFVVGFITMLVVAGCQYYKMRKKCTDNGGQWIKYNCRMLSSWKCTYHTDANGMQQLTECHTEYYERCDEKCVGANAEAQ